MQSLGQQGRPCTGAGELADTLQAVAWALERPCALRRAENWTDPGVTWNELRHARNYASASQEGRVFGDECITTTRFGNGIDLELPVGGFAITKSLAPLGGISGVRAACIQCEANVNHEDQRALVGCYGSVHVPPDSRDLEARIVGAIESTALGTDLAKAFVVTSPHWYGFWINPVIQPDGARLLGRVLTAAGIDTMAPEGQAFLLGLKAAATHDLRMHVDFRPPGHVDLGFRTVFPHCPRCKAEADLPRWRGSYPADQRKCRVCGQRFSPAATASSKPEELTFPPGDELVRELGEQGWTDFARSYLKSRGHSDDKIDRAISRYWDLERAKP
jgi:hypothetical protein